MGTDIHAFIEMDWSEQEERFAEKEQIYAFNFGGIANFKRLRFFLTL